MGIGKAGRITCWEQQRIGLNTAKMASACSRKDEMVQAEDADFASNTRVCLFRV